jgi:hypothetical protein
MQPLWPPFLDHVSAAESRQTETRNGAGVVTTDDIFDFIYVLDDDDDVDDEDEDDDFDDDDGDEGEEDDEDGDDEDVETWQVRPTGSSR